MVPCPNKDCGDGTEPGYVVINPDWPLGDEPFRERCPECGGEAMIPEENAP